MNIALLRSIDAERAWEPVFLVKGKGGSGPA
jgi:hypothetical protein